MKLPYASIVQFDTPSSQVIQLSGQKMKSLKRMIIPVWGVISLNLSASKIICVTEALLCIKNSVYIHYMAQWQCLTEGTIKYMQNLLGKFHCHNISKKLFRPGAMATSEWTRSVRAVRDIPLAAYSAPGIKTLHQVAYRPPNAVSLFLLALSVSYFKRTLWHWRPTVTIHWNWFIGHALESGLQCDGWHCEKLSARSIYLRAKCNSLFTNRTHHSKSPYLCGY
jgi:hypothetical protein